VLSLAYGSVSNYSTAFPGKCGPRYSVRFAVTVGGAHQTEFASRVSADWPSSVDDVQRALRSSVRSGCFAVSRALAIIRPRCHVLRRLWLIRF
jgi:hypothetical protein